MDRKGMEPSEQSWEVQDDTSAVRNAKSNGVLPFHRSVEDLGGLEESVRE